MIHYDCFGTQNMTGESSVRAEVDNMPVDGLQTLDDDQVGLGVFVRYGTKHD